LPGARGCASRAHSDGASAAPGAASSSSRLRKARGLRQARLLQQTLVIRKIRSRLRRAPWLCAFGVLLEPPPAQRPPPRLNGRRHCARNCPDGHRRARAGARRRAWFWLGVSRGTAARASAVFVRVACLCSGQPGAAGAALVIACVTGLADQLGTAACLRRAAPPSAPGRCLPRLPPLVWRRSFLSEVEPDRFILFPQQGDEVCA